MPFNLIWNKREDCWTVINTDTGKIHAKCTSLSRAKKQYYLLSSYEDDNCFTKRKSPCITSPSCKWIVGKGCRPDDENYRNLPWKKNSKLTELQLSEKLGMCNRLRTKKKCVDEEKECEWETGKGCRNIPTHRRHGKSPPTLKRRKSPLLSKSPPRRKSPKRSQGCSRLRKSPCMVSPLCRWTVGKGCSPK